MKKGIRWRRLGQRLIREQSRREISSGMYKAGRGAAAAAAGLDSGYRPAGWREALRRVMQVLSGGMGGTNTVAEGRVGWAEAFGLRGPG